MPEQLNGANSEAPQQSRQLNPVVETILNFTFPTKVWLDLASAFSLPNTETENGLATSQLTARIEGEREKLLALPEVELKQRYLQVQAIQKQRQESQSAEVKIKKEAKAAAKEAARFYNQPEATADFEFWSKA